MPVSSRPGRPGRANWLCFARRAPTGRADRPQKLALFCKLHLPALRRGGFQTRPSSRLNWLRFRRRTTRLFFHNLLSHQQLASIRLFTNWLRFARFPVISRAPDRPIGFVSHNRSLPDTGGRPRNWLCFARCVLRRPRGPRPPNWLCFARLVPPTSHLKHQTSNFPPIGFVSHSQSRLQRRRKAFPGKCKVRCLKCEVGRFGTLSPNLTLETSNSKTPSILALFRITGRVEGPFLPLFAWPPRIGFALHRTPMGIVGMPAQPGTCPRQIMRSGFADIPAAGEESRFAAHGRTPPIGLCHHHY